MRLTEAEKKDIMSKYDGTTSDELLTYLKRHFPVIEIKLDWMEKPLKQISIDYKTYMLEHNKKYYEYVPIKYVLSQIFIF